MSLINSVAIYKPQLTIKIHEQKWPIFHSQYCSDVKSTAHYHYNHIFAKENVRFQFKDAVTLAKYWPNFDTFKPSRFMLVNAANLRCFALTRNSPSCGFSWKRLHFACENSLNSRKCECTLTQLFKSS